MKLKDAVIMVTGANRGIGKAFAEAAVEMGARKVYAAVRSPQSEVPDGAIKVLLDVTDPGRTQEVARELSDVTLVVQNAGIFEVGNPLDPQGDESLRRLLETNFWGVLNVARAFAPALISNRGGMIHVVSVGSWTAHPVMGNYSTSKTALWGLTNNLRQVLEPQGVRVVALHMGYVDTDMVRTINAPKISPSELVSEAYAGFEAGEREILVGPFTKSVKAGLGSDKATYLG